MSPSQGSLPELINGGPSRRGWSRLGTLTFCLQKYALTYGTGKRSAPSPEQAAGTVIHAGLAHTYARRGATWRGRGADDLPGCTAAGHRYTDPAQLLEPREAMAAAAAEIQAENGIKVNVDNAIACVAAYFDHYREVWRVLHVEDEYSADVADPDRKDPEGKPLSYLYTGRADLVVEIQGRTLILDHKTMGGTRATPQLQDEYSLSGQMIGWQWLGEQVYGNRFGGVLLNLVGRDAPYRFIRPPLHAAYERVRQFPWVVIDAERRLADMGDRDLASYTPQLSGGDGCMGRFGGCKVAEKCRLGRNIVGGS